MSSRRSAGFSHLGLIALVVVVVAVGLSFWWVKDHHKKTSVATNSSSSQQYLTIKEWAVRIKLTSDISDATYSMASDSSGNYLVYTQTMNKRFPDCKYDGFIISRLKPGEPYNAAANPDLKIEDAASGGSLRANIKRIADYYFVYRQAEGAYCADQTKPTTGQQMTEQEAKNRESFGKAFQTLEKAS